MLQSNIDCPMVMNVVMKRYSRYLLLILVLGIVMPYSIALPMHAFSHLLDFHDKANTADKCDLCQLTQGGALLFVPPGINSVTLKQSVLPFSAIPKNAITASLQSTIRAPPVLIA
ncbi:hypothetical protein [Gynuella sp.]|uniref:hypothetical protein n=1 Tax=Gynuella sp. TaxID=2969146 RepID=UPI003D0B03B3